MDKDKVLISKIRNVVADEIAEQLCSVQPIDPQLIQNLFKAAKSEAELRAEGYEPVSQDTRMMWVKKDNNQ